MEMTWLCGLCLFLLNAQGDYYLPKQLLKPSIVYKTMGEPQGSELCQSRRCTELV